MRYTLLFCLLISLSLVACKDDTDNPTTDATVYDIVRLNTYNDSGCSFTLSKPNSDQTITYYSKLRPDTTKVPVGDRLQIAYSLPNDRLPYTTGNINLKAYGLITNADLQTLPFDEITDWDKTPVYLLSAWISDRCLNLNLRLPYDETPRQFTLARNADSPDPTSPDLYLIHALEADVTTFDRNYYASFDITPLFDDPDITSFTLHIADSNLNLSTLHLTLPK